MKNAFVVDYIADTMRENGFVMGSISSYDGFVRNLDGGSGTEYAFNIFDREGTTVYQAGVMRYDEAMSIVYLRDHPVNNSLDWQHYYEFKNGEIRTAYIDAADGYCKTALNDLVVYSPDTGCAEILFQVMPVYVNDQFEARALTRLLQSGIYSIYCDDKVILYNESSLVLTDLYDDGEVQYAAKYAVDQDVDR